MNKIVIVGGGAAGLSAALNARRTRRDVDVKVVSEEPHPAYSRCGLPFVISGEIEGFEKLYIYPFEFYRTMRIDLLLKSRVLDVDVKAKTVRVLREEGKEERLAYDSLIIATGARPFIPPIKGVGMEGVYPLRTMDDARMIRSAASNAKEAVVIGGGPVGLEVANALVKLGLKVTLVEALNQVMRSSLDEDVASIIHKAVESSGVRLILGGRVSEFLGNGRLRAVVISGEEFKADLAVLAIGVRVNNELASKIGLELGPTGGIKVNPRMETSISGIYAAGDCVESIHMLSLTPTLCQLGTVAVRQGRVAGINAAGGYAIFPGVLASIVTKAFDLEVGSTGLTVWQAKRLGIDVAIGAVTWKSHAEYYPGAKDLRVKLVFERSSMRLIGGQVIGGEGVAAKVDALALAIQSRMTAYDLVNMDSCYTPPLADVWNPIALAAEIALRRA
ncbi:MAG: FAD-dependent oxidoreductase [Candidatus Nezhaarchaeales archaeon]